MHLDYEEFHLFVGIVSAVHNFTTCLCLLSVASGGRACIQLAQIFSPLPYPWNYCAVFFFILCIFAIKSSGGNNDVKLCEGAFWWCSVYVQKWCLAAPFYYCYQNPLSLLIVFDGIYLPESNSSLQLLVSVCIDHLSSCIILKYCQITFGLWMLEGGNVMPCNSQQTYTYKYLINQAPLI